MHHAPCETSLIWKSRNTFYLAISTRTYRPPLWGCNFCNTKLEKSSWICCSCKCTLLFAKVDLSTGISNAIVLHKHDIFLCDGNGAESIPTYLTAALFLANVTLFDHQCEYHVQHSPLDPSISNSSHLLWMWSHAQPSWCWFLSSLRFLCHVNFWSTWKSALLFSKDDVAISIFYRCSPREMQIQQVEARVLVSILSSAMFFGFCICTLRNGPCIFYTFNYM